jgi:DNA-directed RNA polymerase specialized sigma24 family protein
MAIIGARRSRAVETLWGKDEFRDSLWAGCEYAPRRVAERIRQAFVSNEGVPRLSGRMAIPDSLIGTDSGTEPSRATRDEPAARVMSRDHVAAALDACRVQIIGENHRAFPSLPREDLEDLYSEASIDALRRQFADADALRAYVRRYLHNRAISLKESPRIARMAGTPADHHPDLAPGPYEQALEHESMALLHEFLAEQSEQDRNIMWMLASGHRPAQIARALGISREEATDDCKPLRSSLDRFVALHVRPAAICARRHDDVIAWQQTGRMPLTLRWHLRWHHACGLVEMNARQAAQHALVPLVPAADQLRHTSLLEQLYHTIATHRVTSAAHDAMARGRRFVPAGGGGAAAGAGAIKAVAILGASAAAFHAITATPPAHHQRSRSRGHVKIHAATEAKPAAPALPVVTTTSAARPTTTSQPTPTPTPTARPTPRARTTTPTTATRSAAPDTGASTPPSTASSGSSATASSASASSSPAASAATQQTPVQQAAVQRSPTSVSPSGDGASSRPASRGDAVRGTSSALGAGGTPP